MKEREEVDFNKAVSIFQNVGFTPYPYTGQNSSPLDLGFQISKFSAYLLGLSHSSKILSSKKEKFSDEGEVLTKKINKNKNTLTRLHNDVTYWFLFY